jgi:UDP-N-acetylglucosamine transferase subunit ALG13
LFSIKNFNIRPGRKSRVLIAPLDWGLGHASRCIPIINYLKSIGCDVVIAIDGIQKNLLQQEFPNGSFIELPGYGITFSRNRVKTLIKILWQIPKILITIKRERHWLSHFLDKHEVDLVISDNRYGFSSEKTMSVFLTHQLTIKTYINKYAECWVPDFEGNTNMGGELSHPPDLPGIPVKFIGRLSRMTRQASPGKKTWLLIILSGPEPQRSIFEKILLNQLQAFSEDIVLVRGLPGESSAVVNYKHNLSIYNHLSTTALNELINSTTFIISRSGYSTVMDVTGFNKKCIFVATPGQSEQEYLARYLSSKGFCINVSQGRIDLKLVMQAAEMFNFLPFDIRDDQLYQHVIAGLINKLNQAD